MRMPCRSAQSCGVASDTVLGLQHLAVVQVGKLAAAGAPRLPALRQAVLLVAQPEEHLLQWVQYANESIIRMRINRHYKKGSLNGTKTEDRRIAARAAAGVYAGNCPKPPPRLNPTDAITAIPGTDGNQ
jgi:hypothetical protein